MILYRVGGPGMIMWLTRDGMYCQFTHPVASELSGEPRRAGSPEAVSVDAPPGPGQREVELVKLEFVEPSCSVSIRAEGEMGYGSNYFLGSDPARWRTDVPSYTRVVFQDLYPGIDLVFSGERGLPECRVSSTTGAGMSQVRVRLSGAHSPSVNPEGEVELDTSVGPLRHRLVAGVRLLPLVDGTYRVEADLPRSGSAIEAASAGLNYGTFVGGSSDDRARAIAIDAAANAFVAGHTASVNFPTKTPYQTDQTSSDAFVFKLSPAGNSLVYATYLGGASGDVASGIAVNSAGNAFVTGSTSSSNFPTLSPYQSHQGSEDVFIVKLGAAGNSLVFGTYVGGSGLDNANAIAVNDSGNAFVTGTTASTNFPTQGAYQPDQGASDAFVLKLHSAGNSLLYSTYLGGSGADAATGIALNSAGNAFVTGTTSSTNFPTLNPYQTDKIADDAFVVKLSAAGNTLVYGTYLGGSGTDKATGIAIDGPGNAYVTGATASVDFPTKTPYQNYVGEIGFNDAFVAKLNAAGNGLVYGTYLGGALDDVANAIDVDNSGNAYLAGTTWSPDFPTANPGQLDMDTSDAFVAKLGATGSVLAFSTYVGGTYRDEALAITANDSGFCYAVGFTLSPDFLTQNAYQVYQAGQDAFVAKFSSAACPITKTGDINGSGTISSADIIALVNFVFKGGAHPQPCDAAADVNCSGSVSSADIIFLVNHVFKGAAAPCDACGSSLAGGC